MSLDVAIPEVSSAPAASVVLRIDAEAAPANDVTASRIAGRWSEAPLETHLEQLRQRLLVSEDALTGRDLLDVLLLFCVPGPRAVGLAAELMDRFGSLGGCVAAPADRLRLLFEGNELGVLLLKAVHTAVRRIVREPLQDRTVIGSGAQLLDYLSVTMRHEAQECVRILFLDRKNGLVRDELHCRGTLDHAPLYPRELVRRVLELEAAAIILVHNHPSGDPTPSQIDIDMTRQLATALGAINVTLHDHVIVGRNREFSFRRRGLLQP